MNNKIIFIILNLLISSSALCMELDQAQKEKLGQELLEAVARPIHHFGNRIDRVKELVMAGANLNIQNNDGFTALMYATNGGFKEISELLIKAGADVNIKSNDGSTALMKALFWNNNKEIVELLIKAHADVNSKDRFGNTALINASSKGYQEIVQMLIEAGANVNAKSNGDSTALMGASLSGHTEIVKLLIGAGADVKAKDFLGYTALGNAVKEGHKEIVELLIQAGAGVNVKASLDTTALINATTFNHREIVELLIKSGADISAKNMLGRTALDIALSNKNQEIVNIINAGIQRRKEIAELKQELFTAIESGDFDKVKELVKEVTLKVYDQDGNNPLHIAAKYNKPEIFKLIFSIRPELATIKNKDGQLPLDYNPQLITLINKYVN